MIPFLRKHSTKLLVSLLILLLILARLFPSAGLILGICFLLSSFSVASIVVLEKHKELYRKGKITRAMFIRNATLEITTTWVAMLIAGILGRYAAKLATQQISHETIQLVAGIAVGLVVGMSVGALAQRMLGRLLGLSPGS